MRLRLSAHPVALVLPVIFLCLSQPTDQAEASGAGIPLPQSAAASASPKLLVSRDLLPPVVAITNLSPRQAVRDPGFTVKGIVRDNVGVNNVWCRLNGSPWIGVAGSNTWSAPLQLRQPTNLFQVFATDGAGNHSRTSSIPFAYIATDHLTLATNGMGRILCYFRTNLLDLGKKYMVQALPGAGQIFSGWQGTTKSTANPLVFTMQSNMVLTADFVPTPFLPLQGQYNGLFYPGNHPDDNPGWITATNCGFFTLKLLGDGRFTGKLVQMGVSLPFAGKLGLDLQTQVSVRVPGGSPLTLVLWFGPSALEGLVLADQWRSDLLAYRAYAGNSNSFAGTYTFLHEVCADCTFGDDFPKGDGPGSVTVAPTGVLRMIGNLPDGIPVIQTTTLSQEGFWPLYLPLYGGRGLLIGWMNLNTNVQDEALFWVKPPSLPNQTYYPDGFFLEMDTLLTKYSARLPGGSLLGWTNGLLVIGEGNLPNAVTNHVLSANNRVRLRDGEDGSLNLIISPQTGLFQGTFLHPATRRLMPLRGAVVQEIPAPPPPDGPQGSGGWFLGTNRAGFIRLQPLTP